MTTYAINLDNDGNGSIVVTDDGQTFIVTSDDPKFPLYMDAALEGKPLSEIESTTVDVTPLVELSDRVSVEGDRIFFDGDEVHDALARTIHRYYMEGRPFGGLVRFMELLSLNPNEHSREQLWDWVRDRDLEVDNEGFIIGYRGVDTDMRSIQSGVAFVDDVRHEGHIPNVEGSVISMPRNEVTHNPAVGCAPGLHVGTKNYAEGWSRGVLLTVRVNPIDVVSVPTDCNGEKMRVCRYKVIDVHNPRKDYEPTALEGADVESLEDRITSHADDDETRTFMKKMLDRIRGN